MWLIFPDVLFTTILFFISIMDLKTLMIHTPLVLSSFILILIFNSFQYSHFPIKPLVSSFIAYITLFLISIFTKGKLGMGDVKLSLLTGGYLGAYYWFISLFIASILGLILTVPLLKAGKIQKNTPIPFAPFLSIGAVMALFLKKEGYFAP